MKALQLSGTNKLDLIETETPSPPPGYVLIRTQAATICTSDLNDIARNPFNIEFPVILGHEGAGIVAETGDRVSAFKPGDRVAAHPVEYCMMCAACRKGKFHQCEGYRHFGIDLPGTMAEYFIARQDRVRKIDDTTSFTTATLAEPISVCLEALYRAQLEPGDRLCIIGDGPFGILISRLALTFSSSRIVVLGRHDFRLGFCKHADGINLRSNNMSPERFRKESGGFDAVICAAGSAQAVQEGLSLLRSRGRLVLFSAVNEPVTLDLLPVHLKELSIVGSCNDEDYFGAAVDLLSDARVSAGDLITHTFPLEEFTRAFDLAQNGRDRTMKVSFVFSPSEPNER